LSVKRLAFQDDRLVLKFRLDHYSNLERGGEYTAAGFGNCRVRCSFSGNFVR
jgi:hypothetical protein